MPRAPANAEKEDSYAQEREQMVQMHPEMNYIDAIVSFCEIVVEAIEENYGLLFELVCNIS